MLFIYQRENALKWICRSLDYWYETFNTLNNKIPSTNSLCL